MVEGGGREGGGVAARLAVGGGAGGEGEGEGERAVGRARWGGVRVARGRSGGRGAGRWLRAQFRNVAWKPGRHWSDG